jgi:hypothetical protein
MNEGRPGGRSAHLYELLPVSGVQLYNTERPHSSLKYQSPEEFSATRPFDKTRWAQPLELRDGSALAPIGHAAE